MISKEELDKLGAEIEKLRKYHNEQRLNSDDKNDPMYLDIMKSLDILDNKIKYYSFNYSVLSSRREMGLDNLDL